MIYIDAPTEVVTVCRPRLTVSPSTLDRRRDVDQPSEARNDVVGTVKPTEVPSSSTRTDVRVGHRVVVDGGSA